ncbi:MAG: carbohydrate ABC transporter permease [Anaerolineae bacterium]|nr:carbohydrate ABC transporter permease [Anaerolineae bacterium]
MMSFAKRFLPSKVFYYVILTIYAAISIYPFLWMVSSSLKSNREVYGNKSLIPNEFHFEVLIDTWNQLEFFKYSVNSVVISVTTVLGIILVYSMAGYGFAKTEFKGRDIFFLGFLGVLLVPGVSVLIPLVQLVRSLGLGGANASQAATYAGLILPMINGAGPFAIFFFRNFFRSLPNELHDAARVDGCSEWGIYYRIYLPLSAPVIATVGILNFIASWNGYILPSILINNEDWFTLPLKLRDLDLQAVIQWNVRMAGSLITVVPIIILFLLLQRYYIRGLTAGATKG